MQTYMERAAQVACESDIAVWVLLSSGNDDVEFVSLRPHLATQNQMPTPGEFTARGLRPVGVLGLFGLRPRCSFKEPLPPRVVDAIAAAFLEYVRVMIGEQFAATMQTAELVELERLYRLPDDRLN